MRKFISCTILSLLSCPLQAAPTQDWSALIAKDGLARTETAITDLSDPSAEDLLALAMTQFLGGIEAGLHDRWKVGQSQESALPLFRLPVPANPNPAPFDPALVETVFRNLETRMEDARATLSRIPAEGDIGLVLRPADLWLDIDGSGDRAEGESILAVGANFLAQPRFNFDTGVMETPQMPKVDGIRFDRADVSWLTAYTHLLSATSNTVLAFQPTAVIEQVFKGRKALIALGTTGPADQFMGETGGYPNSADMMATALLALRQQPLADHTRKTRDHLLAMVNHNRRFWTEVAAETDNDQEWIPNKHQTSALGALFPEGVDVAWLAILDDAEKLLKGELLVPYGESIGFDVSAWLENPGPVDLVEWLHGMGMAPFLKTGPQISNANWRAFEGLVSGNAVLFAIWLN